ncbi:hypothetical protein AMAG_19944 [Allomyces macrogynus ATCC 38327]|uniref:Uncharacterized protein n=1 Tax=Allomyces macrogynus (strain ATCC 38327) TaxID=578462 RepID=A0A0L0T2H2_ALLM3|nr:hypothetical protein AMAG_19944 [Allomyces macrogynus ATCC 38327]|eukprot:KNE69028.1 hypothetical protein AMAG_19944 [Allomyces macrogynus ATCC 38327]
METVTAVSIAPEMLAFLPPSLTVLKVALIRWQTNAIVAFPVPLALQSLSIHPIANPLAASALAQQLLATLQRLDLLNHITSDVMVEMARYMPRRLRSLALTGPLGARGWVMLAPALPETLTRLDLTWSAFKLDEDLHPTRTAPEDGEVLPLFHAIDAQLRKIEHLGLHEVDRGFTDTGASALVQALPPSTRSIVVEIARDDFWRTYQLPEGEPRYTFVLEQLLELRVVNAPHLYQRLLSA